MTSTATDPQTDPQTEPQTTPGLFTKLVAAQEAIGVVGKDGHNAFHNYDYTSIEGVVKATRDELAKRKLLVLCGVDHIEERERPTREGVSVVSDVHVIFTVLDAETGEKLEIPWIGRGDDPADKGCAKALTDARKTFMIQLLNIARGDDTEADQGTDERTYGGPRQQVNGGGTVNLVDHAKGLSDANLNQALVAAGLPAQAKPYGAFYRIPADKASAVRDALADRR